MTMYITVVATHRIVQASDRRITRWQAGRLLPPKEDKKAILVDGLMGRFALVYAGLAAIRSSPTDELLVDILREVNPNASSVRSLFVEFASRLTQQFSKIAAPKMLSISAAGFLPDATPFHVLVTNCEDNTGAQVLVRESFTPYGRVFRPTSRRSKRQGTFVIIGGIADTEGRKIVQGSIRQLQRSRFFHRVSSEAVAGKLVEIIHSFAESPASQNLVGKECLTTVLYPNPATGDSFQYHSPSNNISVYGPNFVFHGGSATNFKAGILGTDANSNQE